LQPVPQFLRSAVPGGLSGWLAHGQEAFSQFGDIHPASESDIHE
jgi:hypothetical protein